MKTSSIIIQLGLGNWSRYYFLLGSQNDYGRIRISKGEVPFKNVYFTGIVRDKQRRKMSKSLGNSPDPIELIEKYGADGVR